MTAEGSVLLALDLLGTFAFALNGALTALRVARLDIVGVVTLGMITALGGGIIRDVLLGSLPITVLDAAGLSLFAVTGAAKAAQFGLGPAQSVILGAVTGVGGGTLRDVLVRQVPSVLSSGLYAVPALIGATAAVVATLLDVHGPATAVGAAALCFLIRMVGVRYDLGAPMPPRAPDPVPG